MEKYTSTEPQMRPRGWAGKPLRMMILALMGLIVLATGVLNHGLPDAFVSLLSFVRAPTVVAIPSSPAPSGTKYLFVFGDSYTSTGFNLAGSKPGTANPLGNPPLPGDTTSGGLTWPGFLATQFNMSLTLAYCFAVSGATVDNSVIPSFANSVPSLSDQVNIWSANLQSRPSYAPWKAENALVAVWIGVNDVGNSFLFNSEEKEVLVHRLRKDRDRLFDLLQDLYEGGARNFALLNIPPTQKTPRMKWLSRIEVLVSFITLWNSELPARVAAFRTENLDANITLIDTQGPWETILSDPGSHGAPNADCINPNGKSCLWHDPYHPGIVIQKAVAATVATALRGHFF